MIRFVLQNLEITSGGQYHEGTGVFDDRGGLKGRGVGAGVARTHQDGERAEGEDRTFNPKTQQRRSSSLQRAQEKERVCQVESWFVQLYKHSLFGALNLESPRSQ